MAKSLCLMSCSIILNILLSGLYLSTKWKDNNREYILSWTRRAAEEAEEVASLSCSGHGRAFLDGLVVDGGRGCECYACYTGPDCSVLSFPCVADAESGNPLFLEPFWMEQSERSGVLVSGWHRLGYGSYPGKAPISTELKNYILRLHDLVGNAVTKGRQVVFGTGSTQLLIAAVHALSNSSSSMPAHVVASIPYYPLYQVQTDFFQSRKYEFKGDVSLWKNKTHDAEVFIEFVTSPNNPDGQLKQNVLQGPLVKTIYDHVYYWPHYTAIPAPADEDVMVFSISKLTGHAGSRFGWALVKDEAVYQKISEFISYSTMEVSHDTQLRAFELLKTVVDDGGGRQIFAFGHRKMKGRWQSLKSLFSVSTRFSIQDIPPQFCTFYQRIREPSPAYAWVKCEREEDKDCHGVLKAAGIIGREGWKFGAEDRYVRLSLLKSQDDFELLLQSVQTLVSSEHELPRTVE